MIKPPPIHHLQYKLLLDALVEQLETNTSKDTRTMVGYWTQLTVQLNSLGVGAKKAAAEWQDALKCWLRTTQTKARRISENDDSEEHLTSIEQRLLDIFGQRSKSHVINLARTVVEQPQANVKVSSTSTIPSLPLESVRIDANSAAVQQSQFDSKLPDSTNTHHVKMKTSSTSAGIANSAAAVPRSHTAPNLPDFLADHQQTARDSIQLVVHITAQLRTLRARQSFVTRILLRQAFDGIVARVQMASESELARLLEGHSLNGAAAQLADPIGTDEQKKVEDRRSIHQPTTTTDGRVEPKESVLVIGTIEPEKPPVDKVMETNTKKKKKKIKKQRNKPLPVTGSCATCKPRRNRITRFRCSKCDDRACLEHSQVFRRCLCCCRALDGGTADETKLEDEEQDVDTIMCCFRCEDLGPLVRVRVMRQAANKSTSEPELAVTSTAEFKRKRCLICKINDNIRRGTRHLCQLCSEPVCIQHSKQYQMCSKCTTEKETPDSK